MDPVFLRPLPPHAEKALAILEASGFEAWCVGGCVRDSLLGRSPKDWDITTSALPSEIKECFRAFPTVDTGIKHGTVTVFVEELPLEITTFRSDGSYTDARHPDSVRFSRNLQDDLSRRDFTVNALAYHPQRGLVDQFGGMRDLEDKIIRCVGQPEQRFFEDALRILRCLRFSSVLSFRIDLETRQAALNQRKLLSAVSRERVRDELSKLLCGKNAAEVLRSNSEVVFTVLPTLIPMKTCTQETKYHCFDVWEHTLHALEAAPSDPVLRWAALLHDCGKPACKFFSPDGTAHFHGHPSESERLARELLCGLRFSNRETEEICTLIRYHGERPPLPEKRLKKLLGLLGKERMTLLFELIRADLSAKEPSLYIQRIHDIEESEALAERLLAQNECLSLQDLAVNGNDLIALGFPKGQMIGKTLAALLDTVLDGNLENSKEALTERAKQFLAQT